MQWPKLTYRPTLLPEVTEKRLSLLLNGGRIRDEALDRRISSLDQAFRRYADRFPYGMWAPGLIITPEMRSLSEALFPMADLEQVFRLFFTKSLSFEPFYGASILHHAISWPDALHKLQGIVKTANPALLLQTLLNDPLKRRRFLFLNFLPNQYGGNFNRYPKQMAFLGHWLRKNKLNFGAGPRCLDAACGCGEGSYDLAKLLLECDFSPETIEIYGSTIEPFELFAAAHCFFPHNSQRQDLYRHRTQPLFQNGITDRMHFFLEDLLSTEGTAGGFNVILCNGILGGRFLNQRKALELVIAEMVGRLKPGGILLVANRFHDGWKKLVPETLLAELLSKSGLDVLSIGEGLVGTKT